jgi:hypothetical protein
VFGGDALGIMPSQAELLAGTLLCIASLALGGLLLWWGRRG